MFYEPHQPFLADRVEERADVGVQDEVHPSARDPHHQCVQRVMLATFGAKSVAEAEEFFLVDRVQHRRRRLLEDLVLQSRDGVRALFPIGLRDVPTPRGLCAIGSAMDTIVQISELLLEVCPVILPSHTVCTGSGVAFEREERFS